uniref:RING-type domain-containing protein n=1 Tax=viral metagenome TaxID=1070528 RepID=A0A6C0IIE0_9ZZZZ
MCEHSGMCAFEACKSCIKTYLTGITSDPNCMQCNKAWSDQFLAKQLGTTYLRTEYMAHRKELLVQQQISRMPDTMAAADLYKQVTMFQTQIKNLQEEYKSARAYIYDLHQQNTLNASKRSDAIQKADVSDAKVLKKLTESFKKECIRIDKELKNTHETRSLIQTNIRKIRHDIAVLQGGEPVVEVKKEEARKFIMPCPFSDCRGYLSTHYKCNLCENHTCAKCFELIGLDKEESGHECKQENIDSAEFIRKQAKPCPCCGTRISKIDGCDQMWCTQCHKAFSWNTGKIVTGTIHNPHFYQYQREQGGGAAPRNPGDVVCGGLPNVREVTNKITTSGAYNSRTLYDFTILNIHRLQLHFTAFNVEPLRREVRDEQDYEKERIQYIVQEISREELATKVIRKDKARKIKVAVLHVCELFIAVGIDLFQQIMSSEKTNLAFADELEARIAEYDNLRQYCNEQFKGISMLYGVCVPVIDNAWKSETWKYNSRGETDKYILKREERHDIVRKERERRMEEFHKAQEERNAEYMRLMEAQRNL